MMPVYTSVRNIIDEEREGEKERESKGGGILDGRVRKPEAYFWDNFFFYCFEYVTFLMT